MSEARSKGARAGSERPGVGCAEERAGWGVGGSPRPGGGGTVGEVDEKIVRLGLGGMGVPCSSSSVGGRGTG